MEASQPISEPLLTTARQLGVVLPAALLPATQRQLAGLFHARLLRYNGSATAAGVLPPSFPYQDLPATERLHYELVSWANYSAYLNLFANDPSPFVDKSFKQLPALEEYVADLLTYARYSAKRGGCDWLLRLRTTGQPVGVLHLFDLSHERFTPAVPPCEVGYALAEPFRRQGLGREALLQLLTQAAGLFGRTEARASSAIDNLASQALLRSCGFREWEDLPLEGGPVLEGGPAPEAWAALEWPVTGLRWVRKLGI